LGPFAPPDGYTLLMITASNMVNTTLFKLNFIRDISPVASSIVAPKPPLADFCNNIDHKRPAWPLSNE
jgi:hypothetical protein